MNGWPSLIGEVAIVLVMTSLGLFIAGVLRFVIRTRQEIHEARRRIHAVRDRVREPLRAPGNRGANSFTAERTKNDG